MNSLNWRLVLNQTASELLPSDTMQFRFLVVVAVLLLGCLTAARPRTTKKNNQDLDGIGADLEDFIRHRESQQHYQQGFNRRVNAGDLGRSPSGSSKNRSTLDKISDFLKRFLSGN